MFGEHCSLHKLHVLFTLHRKHHQTRDTTNQDRQVADFRFRFRERLFILAISEKPKHRHHFSCLTERFGDAERQPTRNYRQYENTQIKPRALHIEWHGSSLEWRQQRCLSARGICQKALCMVMDTKARDNIDTR